MAWLGVLASSRMRVGAALAFLGTLLGATSAEGTLRWELKPKVPPTNSLAHPLPLADGRLLVCNASEDAQPCQAIAPETGDRLEVPVSGPGSRFESALALDDGQLLLAHEHALLDVFSGKKRPLPRVARQLSEMRGVAITGGRAAFITGARCERVLFFMGVEVGFREVLAAPAGFCVHDVFDLGDGRVLVTRERAAKTGDDGHIDFVSFELESSRFQRGPSLNHRSPVAVFVHRGEIVVLLRDYRGIGSGHIRSEALFIDRGMKRRKLVAFQQESIDRSVARLDDDRWLLFDDGGSLIWDPTRGTLARLSFPARSTSDFSILRRAGRLFAFFHASREVLALVQVEPSSSCAEVVTYAANALADGSQVREPKRLDELLSPSTIESCRQHVEQTRRFPPSIQVPLEALLQRHQGVATREEQLAARILCTVLPKQSAALVPRINAGRHLDHVSANICYEADAILPLLTEAGKPGLERALVRHGLSKQSGQLSVRWEVQRFLERRSDLAQSAGPFLRAAREAQGFDTLHMALCTSHASGELARACTEVAGRERNARPSPPNTDRPRLARNLAIATGVVGGLAALAYADREGDGGRAIAISSGVAGGATLGFLGTIAFSKPTTDLEGLGTLLLAAAVGVGGAIGGGALATHTSRDPGDERFASAAVPLGGIWLTAVGLTINDW